VAESEAVAEEKARNIVRLRAGGVCEAAIPGICLGRHDTTHHRRKKRYADTRWVASNLLGVCGSGTTGCHGYIEAHPSWAQDEGLWLLEGDDPREVSAHIRWAYTRGWWLLDDEGLLTFDGGPTEPISLHPTVRDFFSPPTSFTRSDPR
jgi:hypothetical protein